MDESTVDEVGQERQIGRRNVIKGVAGGVAAAWTLPIVTSFNTPAFAAASGDPGNPNPECRNAACGTFTPGCSDNPDCVCTSTSTGGGFCVPGSTSCGGLADCVNGTCPPGSLCSVDTCCGRPVCISLSLTCPPSTNGARAAAPNWAAGTIANAG